MKTKMIAFLLLTALLLTGCAAIREENTSSSTENTFPAQPLPTSSPGENNISPDFLPQWQDRVQQLNALYGKEANRLNMARILLSRGSKVIPSRDGEGEIVWLTDAQTPENGNPEGSVKFSGREELILTLDLGIIYDGICDIGLSMLCATDLNAGLPRTVQFFVSEDGESFLLVGTIHSDVNVENNSRGIIELRLQSQISVRYIKAVISAEDITDDNLYIDEMYAYCYEENETLSQQDAAYDVYYQNPPMPWVLADLFWNESEENFDTETNLVAGKSYRIKSTLPIDPSLQTDYYNSPITNKALTDGKAGGSSFSDEAYFHFTRSAERTIIFDLEKVSGVSSVIIGFLCDKNTGIVLPENVIVMGSMDGNIWGEIAFGTPVTTGTGSHRVEFTISFEKTATRFIAVKNCFNSHLWIDEITVNGTKSVENTKALNPCLEEESEYLSTDALNGVENIMLMYTFKNENPSTGLNTMEELLPYVAYHNSNGEIVDTFFDSFLFLPCHTTCPSGGHLYYDAGKPSRASDWLLFEEDLFDKGANMPALSQAVTAMDQALNTDTEMSVFLSIFSTVYGDTGFGNIEGEINGVDFNNIEDRKKVITWWIDRMVERMESGNYGNLRLDGFYWYHEVIEAKDPHEVELIKFTADYVHSLGYYFIWIPYYSSNGFNNWKSYGFDAAVMQPNYMFSNGVPESRLYDNAKNTKTFGLGVEIEMDYGIVSDPAKREKYRNYLRVGVETGYMKSIKMYYQDGGPGVLFRAYQSNDPYYHSVYDDTYRYAKGTLTYELLIMEETAFTGKKDQPIAISLKARSGISFEIDIAMHPKYGTVYYAADGCLYYFAPEGFVGEDTFVIRDPNNDKVPGIVIIVTVEENTEE